MEALTDELVTFGRTQPSVLLEHAYHHLAPSVRGYLKTRGVDDPEAVTHDVFLALYPQLSSIRGGASGLRMLVFAIAHARSVDHHRRRASVPPTTEYDPESDQRTTGSAEDQALESLAGAGALELLAGLNDDQREVLSLRVVADLSLGQTATIMNKSTGAVKQLQHRALTNLRNQLAREVQGTP
ncbi:RNA polymerase sigma factor [Leifsonia sp. NPDC058248]|uniref:RNA polymerase sigma factor n=1 Tax=Leifsonia sp. NPDC058248 TaxID=3346402 RepID=UPI0036DAAD1E